MHYRLVIFVFCVSLLCTCTQASDDEWAMAVNRKSYVLEDEDTANRSIQQTIISTNQVMLFYPWYFSRHVNPNNSNMQTTDFEVIKGNEIDFIFRIHTCKSSLSYHTYTTVGGYPTINNQVRVEFFHPIGEDDYDRFYVSLNQANGYYLKYEYLDSKYDLLTFNYTGIDYDFNRYANFSGRIKVKR